MGTFWSLFLIGALVKNDQEANLYKADKFHGYWKKKIFWAFHQCSPY
jgi:hypothetical protein